MRRDSFCVVDSVHDGSLNTQRKPRVGTLDRLQWRVPLDAGFFVAPQEGGTRHDAVAAQGLTGGFKPHPEHFGCEIE